MNHNSITFHSQPLLDSTPPLLPSTFRGLQIAQFASIVTLDCSRFISYSLEALWGRWYYFNSCGYWKWDISLQCHEGMGYPRGYPSQSNCRKATTDDCSSVVSKTLFSSRGKISQLGHFSSQSELTIGLRRAEDFCWEKSSGHKGLI